MLPLLVASVCFPLSSVPAKWMSPFEVPAARVASVASITIAPLLVSRSSFPLAPRMSTLPLEERAVIWPWIPSEVISPFDVVRERMARAGTVSSTAAPDDPKDLGPVRLATMRTMHGRLNAVGPYPGGFVFKTGILWWELAECLSVKVVDLYAGLETENETVPGRSD